MPPVNRIITRGMGTTRDKSQRAGLVTQGYGGPLAFVLQEIRRIIRVGQSGTKRAIQELQEIVVWAKLIRVNNDPPPVKIEGFIRIKVNAISYYAVTLAEHISTRIRKTWEDVKISISRLK